MSFHSNDLHNYLATFVVNTAVLAQRADSAVPCPDDQLSEATHVITQMARVPARL